MSKKGFSLIEMLVVLAILAIIFAMSSLTIQSLNLTADVIKQNKQYEAISQIYSYMAHLENAIVVKNDFVNSQFLYQLPLLDGNKRIKDPLAGGDWYAIKLQNQQLVKINQATNETIQISPKDVIVKSTTFSFDNFNKQLRVTLDLCPSNDTTKNTRVSIVIDMLNVLNEL